MTRVTADPLSMLRARTSAKWTAFAPEVLTEAIERLGRG